jgi:phosphoglycolate phosphatase
MPAGAREEGAAESLAALAAEYYGEKPLVHSRPYPGIPDLIAGLRGIRIKTAVLTNKPDPVARQVIAGLFPPGSFDIVRGDSPGKPRKPDPGSAWDILMELDVTPRETVFAGDSEVDMETARAAECHALGVSWGYRPRPLLVQAGAQRIIDAPEDLLALVRGTRM